MEMDCSWKGRKRWRWPAVRRWRRASEAGVGKAAAAKSKKGKRKST
jgi:hypothetical protein